MSIEFLRSFSRASSKVHLCAGRHGFWKWNSNIPEKIALMHSELSEMLEALRHGNPPSEHIPDFSGAEEELADLVIRAMDIAVKMDYKLAEAILAKMKFNETRPYKHGKEF